jgi:hypothetical protein
MSVKIFSLSRARNIRALLLSVLFLVFVFASSVTSLRAQAIDEGFESLADLIASGEWFVFNHSDPVNPANPGWFQCTGTQIAPAQGGTTNSCVSANFASGMSVATLNDWLIGPNRTFNNGDTLSFYTREIANNPYPNRMQVRLSLNGTSTNVGKFAEDVGDFTELLLDINPDYQVGGYPEDWTQFTVTIQGLPGPTSGRFAFRYFVENGGPDGDNSYIIGIDTLMYGSGGTPTPSGTPTETPSGTPTETPSGTPTETPSGTPTETPTGTPTGTPAAQHVIDFNGDGRTDFSTVRNAGSQNGQLTWWQGINVGGQPARLSRTLRNEGGSQSYAQPWGLATDTLVPADYDGDQRTDIAVWRPGPPDQGYYYILESSTGTFRQEQFGQEGDDPSVVADYTGDGHADPAVYREGAASGDFSYWHYKASSGPLAQQTVTTHLGQNGDAPSPGDYDGDGKADFVVQRNAGDGYAVFYVHKGTGGADVQIPGEDLAIIWGAPSDTIVPGDYDGDGKTDIATVRRVGGQIEWNIRSSSAPTGNGFSPTYIWGIASDYEAQGDYDGDGRTDAAVWRPNTDPDQNFFYIISSMSGSPMMPAEWGMQGDLPAANYNTH